MISLILDNDMDRVYDLGLLLHDNFKETNSYDSLINNLDRTYKITINDDIIGFIHVQNVFDETNIIDIVIDANYRHKGYGYKLLNFVFDEYKGNRFILEVSSNNINAINFYKKEGFTLINTRKNYYQDGSDALVMEKKW